MLTAAMTNTDMSKRPTRSWPGLGPNTLIVDYEALAPAEEQDESAPSRSATPTPAAEQNELSGELSVKNTGQHKSIIKARNEYYQAYKARFETSIADIVGVYNDLRKEEARFSDYWGRNLREITKKHI